MHLVARAFPSTHPRSAVDGRPVFGDPREAARHAAYHSPASAIRTSDSTGRRARGKIEGIIFSAPPVNHNVMPPIEISDFGRSFLVGTEGDLLARLRTSRHGKFGGFWIAHKDHPAQLGVHVNGAFAFATYFPGAGHPGFQPRGMTPEGCPETVRFLPEDIEMGAEFICSPDAAYRAASEFFREPKLPNCITWYEL